MLNEWSDRPPPRRQTRGAEIRRGIGRTLLAALFLTISGGLLFQLGALLLRLVHWVFE